MDPERAWKIAGECATCIKYLAAAATAYLSVVSLRHETTLKNEDPLAPKVLTPVGRRYMWAVVTLAVLTLSATVLGDVSTAQLEGIRKEHAKEEEAEILRKQLDKQLQEGISPALTTLGTDLKSTTQSVVSGMEEEADRANERLEIAQKALIARSRESSVAQDALLTKARESAAELSNLKAGIEDSAGITRELADKQQRIFEAKYAVGSFRIELRTVPYDGMHAPEARRLLAQPKGTAFPFVDFKKAFFHGSPDLTTEISVFYKRGVVSLKEERCPLPLAKERAPCLKGSGTLDQIAGPATIPASLAPVLGPEPSQFEVSFDIPPEVTSHRPLLAQDMEIDGLTVFECLNDPTGSSTLTYEQLTAKLHAYEETLPAWIALRVQEKLVDTASGREDYVSHPYEYVMTHFPRSVSRGCLQTIYQLSR